MSPSARSSRYGMALALLYAAVAVVYVAAGGRVRPLFDGFAPPPNYRWVDPPKEFAAGNEPPRPVEFTVGLGPDGSVQSGGSSDDGQAIFSFAAGTFPARPPDNRVAVRVTPLDPATLAAPPPGLAPDGNSYRVEFSYQPSGAAAPGLALPADVFLVVPEPASRLLFSADGGAWDTLPPKAVPVQNQVGGSFDRAGYLLAAAPPVQRPGNLSARDGEAGRLLRIGAVTLVLTAGLFLAPKAWHRIRPEQPA